MHKSRRDLRGMFSWAQLINESRNGLEIRKNVDEIPETNRPVNCITKYLR